MYEHNALGYRSGLALCLTKVRSSRARCPATALILIICNLDLLERSGAGVDCRNRVPEVLGSILS